MRKGSPRVGFTLLEILIVIAIIGVLAALTISGTFQLITGQRQSNTEATIDKVNRALQSKWAKVVSDAKNETPSAAVVAWGGTADRAKAIWIKLREMEAFPMSFDEIYNQLPAKLYSGGANALIPQGMQRNLATYQITLTKAGITSANYSKLPVFPNSQSSACLLMALSIVKGGADSFNPDALGSSAMDSDGDGMREIVDGWGTPLFFFRFPTPSTWTMQNPNPNVPDPDDPLGTLLNAKDGWNQAAFNTTVYPVALTNYVIPVIVSAGPNGAYTVLANPLAATAPQPEIKGLGLVMGNTGTMDLNGNVNDIFNNATLANDNIYNFLLRTGGTGN